MSEQVPTKDMTFQSVLPAGEEKLRQLDPPSSKDLLTRLRTGALCEQEGCRCHVIDARSGCQCAEAADEIENLRRENVRWENAHKILLAENERLKKQLAASCDEARSDPEQGGCPLERRGRPAPEPAADQADIDFLMQSLVDQENALNACEKLLKESLAEGGVNVGFDSRLARYWEQSNALGDWRSRNLRLSQPSVGPPWRFYRYRNGHLMAEGIVVEKAGSTEQAMAKAVRMADAGDVLVMRAAQPPEVNASLKGREYAAT